MWDVVWVNKPGGKCSAKYRDSPWTWSWAQDVCSLLWVWGVWMHMGEPEKENFTGASICIFIKVPNWCELLDFFHHFHSRCLGYWCTEVVHDVSCCFILCIMAICFSLGSSLDYSFVNPGSAVRQPTPVSQVSKHLIYTWMLHKARHDSGCKRCRLHVRLHLRLHYPTMIWHPQPK